MGFRWIYQRVLHTFKYRYVVDVWVVSSPNAGTIPMEIPSRRRSLKSVSDINGTGPHNPRGYMGDIMGDIMGYRLDIPFIVVDIHQ